jgi:hypothetical protein
MALELAGWAAKKKRAVLILPSAWLLNPEEAPDGFRRLAKRDSEEARLRGELSFPVMLIDNLRPEGGTRVITEGDWLAFVKE